MGFSVSFGITFLAMMSVLGSICFVAYTNSSASRAQAPAHAEKPTAALPQPEDRLTLLVSAAEASDADPDAYILLSFLPHQGRIAICVLPPDTYLEYGGQGTTIARMYRQGGLPYAKKGVAQYLNIPIQRWARLDLSSLDALLDCQELMDYDLPVDLNYPLRGRQIVMPRGHYQLTGRRVMDIIAYPAYQGGERERSDRAALLIAEMITQTLPLFLDEEQGDRLQQTALKTVDTDLSAADCLQRRSALAFLAQLDLPVTTMVYIEGSLSRDYSVYHLTQGCKSRIWEMYREEPAGG